jgi:FAD/FMN-containing dehydrogenase
MIMMTSSTRLSSEKKLVSEKKKTASAKTLQNWMKATTTTPAEIVKVKTIQEIQDVVRDIGSYTSPIRPTGSMLSHTDIHSSDGGTTLLLMSEMNIIHGIKKVRHARNWSGAQISQDGVCIETEPCATIREIQLHALDHGYELPFSAKIGLATVGGTVFYTTKDSAVGRSPIEGSGLGDVCSCVFSVTVVDEQGELRQYDLFDNNDDFDAEFQSLLDSQGNRGIAVNILLAIRPKTPVTVNTYVFARQQSDSAMVADRVHRTWQKASKKEGNVFAAIGCKPGFCWMEERVTTANAVDQAAPFTWILNPIFLLLKKYIIERCHFAATSVVACWFQRHIVVAQDETNQSSSGISLQ